jgi:hypothetical protein
MAEPNPIHKPGKEELAGLLAEPSYENLRKFFRIRRKDYPHSFYYGGWGDDTETFGDLKDALTPKRALQLLEPTIQLALEQTSGAAFETAAYILDAVLKKSRVPETPAALSNAWPRLLSLEEKFPRSHAYMWMGEIRKRFPLSSPRKQEVSAAFISNILKKEMASLAKDKDFKIHFPLLASLMVKPRELGYAPKDCVEEFLPFWIVAEDREGGRLLLCEYHTFGFAKQVWLILDKATRRLIPGRYMAFGPAASDFVKKRGR